MKKILLILILASGIAKGESLYQFLENSSNARDMGLAGAYVSMPEDPAALFFNPASIRTVEENNFSATFMKHVLDINSGNSVFYKDISDFGSTAASINFASYGSFNYADDEGNISNRTFGGNHFNFGLTYANTLDSNLYYGITAKVAFVSLEEFGASALAFDAGILYQIPEKRLNIGLSILNSGFEMSSMAGFSSTIPLDIRLGLNHRLRGLPLLINFNFHHLNLADNGFFSRFENFAIGGELYLGDNIRARLGYDNRVRNYATSIYDKGLSGISAGVGIVVTDFLIDYGLTRIGSAATVHKISIGLSL